MAEFAFYYAQGSEKVGPFIASQIPYLNLSPGTLVWYTGLKDWMRASDAPLTASFVSRSAPQAFGSSPSANTRQRRYYDRECPSSHMVWAILATLFCFPPFGIVSIVYASRVEKLYYSGQVGRAYKASRNAALWAWLSLIVPILIGIVGAILIILVLT